jgi:hypothetical protein
VRNIASIPYANSICFAWTLQSVLSLSVEGYVNGTRANFSGSLPNIASYGV